MLTGISYDLTNKRLLRLLLIRKPLIKSNLFKILLVKSRHIMLLRCLLLNVFTSNEMYNAYYHDDIYVSLLLFS